VLDMDVKGSLLELILWDGSSCENYNDRYLPLFCQDAHAFLLCFSIDNPASLESVLNGWDPQIKRFGGGTVPRFLVGCKKELRDDEETIRRLGGQGQLPVSAEQGKEAARAIGAKYFECSSKTGEGIRELFRMATESMRAGKVVRGPGDNKGWHRNGECVVV